jgi:hypothetical protein
MKFSTEVKKKMAVMLVQEMQQAGVGGAEIRVWKRGCERCCGRWGQWHWGSIWRSETKRSKERQ